MRSDFLSVEIRRRLLAGALVCLCGAFLCSLPHARNLLLIFQKIRHGGTIDAGAFAGPFKVALWIFLAAAVLLLGIALLAEGRTRDAVSTFIKRHGIALFLVAYFILQIPTWLLPLKGEDGIFANLFINHPHHPHYLLVGRIDGVEMYDGIQHPGLMYALLSFYGRLPQLLMDYSRLSDLALGVLMRVAFSIFYLGISVALLGVWKRKMAKHGALDSAWMFVIISFLLAPALLRSSVELQTDNTVGVLGFGLYSIALLLVSDGDTKREGVTLGLIASLIVATGKNEWSIALCLSIVLTLPALIVMGKGGERKRDNTILLFFLGCLVVVAVGNLANFFFDRQNYLAGFTLISNIGRQETVLTGVHKWVPIAWFRILEMYFAIFVLAMLFSIPFVRRGESGKVIQAVCLLNSFILGACLFVPFFLNTWDEGLRYFLPGIVVILTGLGLALIRGDIGRGLRTASVLVACVVCIQTMLAVAASEGVFLGHEDANRSRLENSDGNTLYFLSTAEGYRDKRIDFIGNSFSLADAQNIATSRGKKLVTVGR